MEISDCIFDCVHLLYYKCHKINLNRYGSYIDSPKWIKNKKAIINPINKKDDKFFQYAKTVVMKTKMLADFKICISVTLNLL